MKVCSTCGVEKLSTDFSFRNKNRGTYNAQCKICQCARNRQYYQDNIEKVRNSQRLYRQENGSLDRERRRQRYRVARDWLVQQKAKPCVDCGGIFHPEAMHFDHLPGYDKVTEVARLTGTCNIQKIQREILKCDLVCANCHAVRTAERRAARVAERRAAS